MYNYKVPGVEYPKKDESIYFHFRYSILSAEQDLEQIKIITECSLIKNYVISVIEYNESETEKGQHRHVAIELHSKKVLSTVKKSLVKHKYNKHQIYLKSKYKGSTVEELINYTIKSGVYLTNWSLVDKVDNKDESEKEKETKKIEEAKQKKADFIEKLKHMGAGDIKWFFENHPKYIFSAEFQKGIVWAQKDNHKPLKQLRNFYIIDKSGLGKTLGVRFLCHPDQYYLKSKMRDSWEGWFNAKHSDFHLDEVDTPDSVECIGGLEGLKELSAHFSFGAKFMYANRILQVNPERIFITANTHPEFVFAKDKHGKPLHGGTGHIKETIGRRFEIWDVKTFFQAFGIRMEEVGRKKKKKDCVIVFDFKGMQDNNYLPKFEYYNQYNIDTFEEHANYWKKYGEEKYIQWRAYKEGIIQAQKELEDRSEYMNNFVRNIGLIRDVELAEVLEDGIYMDETDIKFNNLEL